MTYSPPPPAPPGLINLALLLSLPQWRRYNDLENTPTTPHADVFHLWVISFFSAQKQGATLFSFTVLVSFPSSLARLSLSGLVSCGELLWSFDTSKFKVFLLLFIPPHVAPDVVVPLHLLLIPSHRLLFPGDSSGGRGHSLTCGHASLCCFVVQHWLLEGAQTKNLRHN